MVDVDRFPVLLPVVLITSPPLPECFNQGLEPDIFAQVREIRFVFIHGVNRETVVRSMLEPFDRFVTLVQQRVRTGYVIGSVMEMAKAFSVLYRHLNVPFGFISSASKRGYYG